MPTAGVCTPSPESWSFPLFQVVTCPNGCNGEVYQNFMGRTCDPEKDPQHGASFNQFECGVCGKKF